MNAPVPAEAPAERDVGGRRPAWAWSAVGLFIALSIILPSGDVLGINVKVLSFGAVLVILLLRPDLFDLSVGRWLVALAFTAGLCIWLLRSTAQPDDGNLALMQFKDLYITAAGAFVVAAFAAHERQRFLRIYIGALVAVAAVKLLIVVYAFTTGTPTTVIMLGISEFFGTQLMTYDLEQLGGRIQFVSDNLLPLAIYASVAFVHELRRGTVLTVMTVALLSFSALMGFSRYVWATSAIALVLGIFGSRSSSAKFALIGILALAGIWNLSTIVSIYDARTSGSDIELSDSIRAVQARVLSEFVAEAPLMGNGLGTYVPGLVRDEVVKYSYENQLLALVGQIGVAGVLFVFFFIVLAYGSAFLRSSMRPLQRFSTLVLLTLWVASGLFNPTLMSSCAGICFAAFFVTLRGTDAEDEENMPDEDVPQDDAPERGAATQ